MIKGILFDKEVFNTYDDNNVLSDLTNNVVIICDSPRTKRFLTSNIMQELKDKTNVSFDILSDCDYSIMVQYLPTTILKLGNQRITATVECPFVYQCKKAKDLWFCIEEDRKLNIYPLYAFKGYKDTWAKGIDNVYIETISGHFGVFRYGS